jgi:hypothetical protein
MMRFATMFLLAMTVAAQAQPVAAPAAPETGSNFPALADYPAPSCIKPAPPPKRPSTVNNVEVERFNHKLAQYNTVARDYVLCVNLYVRNADNDMDLIRKKSRAAVDEANR